MIMEFVPKPVHGEKDEKRSEKSKKVLDKE
jgi:hypothetical protein